MASEPRQLASKVHAQLIETIRANGSAPLLPSAWAPLVHHDSGHPLIQLFVALDQAGVPHIKASKPRPSGIDRLSFRAVVGSPSRPYLTMLNGQGVAVVEDLYRGKVRIDYGQCHVAIYRRGRNRPGPSEVEVTLNPNRFWSMGDLIRFLTLLLPGFDPEAARIVSLDCNLDLGVPGSFFKAMVGMKNHRKGASFDNTFAQTAGDRNGFRYGSGSDTTTDYDKRTEYGRRSEARTAAMKDVPWWRIERRLKGKCLPIRTVADLPDLAKCNPFDNRTFIYMEVNYGRAKPGSHSRWLTLLKTLHYTDCILGREGRMAATHFLNRAGHAHRYREQGHIRLTPVPLDTAAEWRAGVGAFCFLEGVKELQVLNQEIEFMERWIF